MTNRRPMSRFVACALAIALTAAACGDRDATSGFAARATAELQASGYGDYLGIQQPSRSAPRPGWTDLFFDAAPEQAICMDGSDFQVSVRHGTSGRAVLYLQGGGACWDHDTCWVDRLALVRANGPIEGGALKLDDPASPFHDDDVVYVPYCDGSVFGGDATVDYDGVRTFHHGLWNTSVAVDVLRREFPDAKQIVVAGSSAGGFGNVPAYAVTRVAFPDTPILVFNDSGPAIENHAVPAAAERARRWQLDARYPASCADCRRQAFYLLDWAMERDSSLRVALYGYQRDRVIMGFFELDAAAYLDLVLSMTDEIRARHPGRLERYLVAGSGHTTLLYRQFYEQSVDGVAIADWTRAFLDGSDGWRDVIE
ncbi:pectinacetylesterase family protein [Candidatus Binatia bacterium]|nr:pectinacetylesterase family protein [Candidatus Binatia bacterium]